MKSPENQVTIGRANVLGVGISALNLDLAVAAVAEALERKTKGYVCVTGVHGVSEAQHDPAFRAILNHAFLNTPDGMPTVWMGRWEGFRNMRRVYGPDLMLRVCEFTRARGYTHFLYGGAPGVAEALKRRLEERFPGLRIVGTYTPPFRPLTAEEEQQLQRLVDGVKPDIFWVGLSTPKQEKFMAQYWQKLGATLFFGVGAAFVFGLLLDVHEGALLGQHALAYTLLGFVATSIHRRLLWFSLPEQALQILPLFFAAHAVSLVIRLLAGDMFPGWPLLFAPVAEALLWPVVTVLLLAPQRRAPDPDQNRPL